MKSYVRIDEVLIALAYCAKQTHSEELRMLANTEAISLITDQDDFLLFVHYCAKISMVLRGEGHSNFGHGMCRLIEKWYAKHSPVDLANMFGEHRSMHGWTHKSVIAKAHMRTKKRTVVNSAPPATASPASTAEATSNVATENASGSTSADTSESATASSSADDSASAIATISNNGNGAESVSSPNTQTEPPTSATDTDENDREHVFHFIYSKGCLDYIQYLEDKTELGPGAQRLKNLLQLKTTENIDTAVQSIGQHKFSLQQMPAHLLESEKVWEALLPTLLYRTLWKSLHTLKDYRFFSQDSPFARKFVDAIGNLNNLKSANICPIDFFIQKKLFEKNLRYLGTKKAEFYEKKMLKRKIEPNQLITERLNSLFHNVLSNAKPTPAKFFVVMDLRKGNEKSLYFSCILLALFQ